MDYDRQDNNTMNPRDGMKMITSTDKTMHAQIMMLLPWYVNHTVNDSDRKRVETHLQSCVSCRIELKYQQQFAERVKHSSDFGFAPKQSFAALKSRIHQSSDSTPALRVPEPKPEPFYMYWLNQVQNALFSSQAVVAVSVFFLLLFSIHMLSIDMLVSSRPSVVQKQFITLASETDTNSVNDIRVVFEKTTSAQTIGQIVSSLNAQIIEGPSRSGVYRIRVDETNEQQLSLDQQIQLWRAQKQVVFVEPTYTALVAILRK
ncbi:MAG TPA: zf-HC2 domain-containing protein [Crenotrichaceae bacterium]|nr:zf-HC2 domain-containing protein [Crenotrichaceae bacterium]